MTKIFLCAVFLTALSLLPTGGRSGLPLWAYTGGHNFGVVEKGRIYRSSEPNLAFLRRLVKERGIKTILILNHADEGDEKEIAREFGVRLLHFPMHIRTVNYAQAKRAAAALADPANQPVLVHCTEGIDRTGFVVALYRLIQQHRPLGEVFTEMLSYNFRPSRNPKMVFFLVHEMREIETGQVETLGRSETEEPEEREWEECGGDLKRCYKLLSSRLAKTGVRASGNAEDLLPEL